ncbi:hypothetical protein LEN26_015057 [Aphanomyces euteiches]|nr:hypothetical protein LEN26_015057 [Aphanomyces euteiches]KAH9129040.1 hypothetical protein AeMF1_000868 [Aphanomyces euteiches]
MEVLLRESGKYDTLTHLEKIMEPQDTPTRQAMQQAPMLQPDPLRLDLSTPHTSSPTTTCSLMKSYEEAIAQASFVPEEMRCRYKTGRCPLARATKRNGRPLLLCEYHRLKQNSIKRKSDTKYRKDRKAQKLRQQQEQHHEQQQQPQTTHKTTWTPPLLELQHSLSSSSMPLTHQPQAHTSNTATGLIPPDEIDMLSYFIL